MDLIEYREIIYWLVSIPSTLFTVLYLYQIMFQKMKTYSETWHLLIFTGAVAVLSLDLAIRQTFYPGSPSIPQIWATSFAIVGVAMWQRLFWLWHYSLSPKAELHRMNRSIREEKRMRNKLEKKKARLMRKVERQSRS